MLFNQKEEYKNLLKKRKAEIEARDVEIFKNIDKKRYIHVKVQPRKIITVFGFLTFKRALCRYKRQIHILLS